MHNRIDIVPHAVNQQVHGEFTGGLQTAGELAAFIIHNYEIVGFQVAFAHPCGGRQDAARVHTHGEIAVSGSNEPGFVQPVCVADKLFAKFAFVDHLR